MSGMNEKVFVQTLTISEGSEYWLMLVVSKETGVIYLNQIGGVYCNEGAIEGYGVLVPYPHVAKELYEVFNGGTSRTLEEVVSSLGFIKGDDRIRIVWLGDDINDPFHLQVDHDRKDELQEAWVPVKTPFGLGILMWNNSD